MSVIQIVIIEPQQIYLQGLLHNLKAIEDINVVASGTTGDDARKLIPEHNPDVAVIGIQLQEISGLAILDELGAEEHKVLFLTNEENPAIILEAMMMGARGYLLKWSPDLNIPNAIRRVVEGGRIMDAYALNLFIDAIKDTLGEGKRGQQLSFRERQILTLLARGFTQRKAAEMLSLEPNTIKTYCRRIYAKLDVHSQTAAVSAAQRLGII